MLKTELLECFKELKEDLIEGICLGIILWLVYIHDSFYQFSHLTEAIYIFIKWNTNG